MDCPRTVGPQEGDLVIELFNSSELRDCEDSSLLGSDTSDLETTAVSLGASEPGEDEFEVREDFLNFALIRRAFSLSSNLRASDRFRVSAPWIPETWDSV